ncbi:response regulator [Gracilimonas sp.]|uniref:response regulator n=1 Tax=Gracilimonas sp. TaxID=1974203 RepID=UPI00287257ED|nr:response regulator [Gracilimonas sp.]
MSKAPKVLIVDDVKENRMLARVILEMGNISIYEAENGEEAIRHFEKHNPDVVFMDLCMPVKDGVEAMQAIRGKAKNGRKVPIIAFTSGEHRDSKPELIRKGFSEYLKKPYQSEELFDKISIFYPISELKTDISSATFTGAK